MNDILQIIIHVLVTLVFAMAFLAVAAMGLVFMERKVQAYIQDRYGPLHYGPGGIFQAFIDPLKLLLKEDIKATATDNIVFRVAPYVFFAPVVTAFVVLPFSPYLTAAALGTGIVFYVALSSIDVIGIFMAGWGSNNKYALIGGLRSTAQMISYELPLVLALVGAVMLSSALAPGCAGGNPDLATCGVGSISFSQIVAAQMRPETPWLWFVLIQPLGLLVYYICGLAETNRTPFDLPEAESELVAGYLTEYSGLRWVATSLFLGGWSGPGTAIDFWTSLLGSFGGQVVFNIIATFWFVFKMFVLLVVFMWIRATLPRLRADQLMRFAWLGLIPLTLFNILLTGVLLLLPIGLTGQLVAAAVANWILLLLVIFGLRGVLRISPKAQRPGDVRGRGSPPRPDIAPQPLPPGRAVEAGVSPR
jgi:NADH-quinone oxidoreductase subunit H